tara:strand:+ start:435 stop:902 length:468 start_codon:yes stop_codon:yes gene_type:complete
MFQFADFTEVQAGPKAIATEFLLPRENGVESSQQSDCDTGTETDLASCSSVADPIPTKAEGKGEMVDEKGNGENGIGEDGYPGIVMKFVSSTEGEEEGLERLRQVYHGLLNAIEEALHLSIQHLARQRSSELMQELQLAFKDLEDFLNPLIGRKS